MLPAAILAALDQDARLRLVAVLDRQPRSQRLTEDEALGAVLESVVEAGERAA